MDVARRKFRVALLSVVSNTTLVILKLIVGLLIGSVAVVSEAIHSGVDLVAALVALFAVRTAHKPADREHRFGHGKIENISGAFEALLIFAAAGWILYEAIGKLASPEPVDAPMWGVIVMGLSAVANLVVSQRLFAVGRATDSVALQADGWHLRTDVWTSFGVMLGLGAVWLGAHVLPGTNLAWVDPAAALVVAVLILHAAWTLTREAIDDLLDRSLPEDELAWLSAQVPTVHPLVHGLHHLRTRKSGATRFIEFHLKVDATMSLEDAHAVSHEVERVITARFPTASVTAHLEPCLGACRPACVEGCYLDEAERAARHAAWRTTHAPDTVDA